MTGRGVLAGAGAGVVLLLASAAPALAAGWRVEPSSNPNPGQDVLVGIANVPGTNTFWAVGYVEPVGGSPPLNPLIERTTGTIWTAVAAPDVGTSAELEGVAAASPTQAWAVGEGSNGLPLILAWNGASWRSQALPTPPTGGSGNLVSVAVISPTDVIALGAWNTKTTSTPITYRWNGSSWKATVFVLPPMCARNSDQLTSISAIPGTSGAVAVGECYGSSEQPIVYRLSGHYWTKALLPAPKAGQLNAVSAESPTNIWAVGNSLVGFDPPLAEHWNGATWTVVSTPTPSPGDTLVGIAHVPNTAIWWANATSVDGPPLVGALEWDGSAWTNQPPVQAGVQRGFFGLAASTTSVWAVGYDATVAESHENEIRTLVELRAP